MNPEKEVTLKEFYLMLERHDWRYEYSDDFSVWKTGSNQRFTLEQIALESDEHANLFRRFHDFMSGKSPKPEAPKED